VSRQHAGQHTAAELAIGQQVQEQGVLTVHSQCCIVLQYRWQSDKLCRVMADSSNRQVPPPVQRMQLVKDTHEHTRHFGEKRTMSLLCNGYWWRGMLDDVRAVVGSCAACDLSRAQFNAQLPMLQPLHVMGLHYRWSVDLCGPFPTSKAGNRYVMVMVEHYSKFVELAALPAKEARHTAAAFTSRVLGRYGAMAEVLTDQGSEWLAEFHQVLERALVDHRMTSAGRPSSNGASERVVQVVKQALRCCCHDTKVGDQWDEDLPWVMLGIYYTGVYWVDPLCADACAAAHCASCCQRTPG
jgi:transposase InsO family protein